MANANQSSSSGRQQARQQASEAGRPTSAQHGSEGGQHTGQQTAWQDSGAEQQASRAVQARRAAWPASPYLGAFGSGPLSTIRRLSEDMDRLFESFGFGRGLFPTEFGQGHFGFAGEDATSLWAPHIEIYERDGKLVVNADLPGVKKEDLNVEITPEAVSIRGQRKQEKTSNEAGYFRSERSYGSFYRTIPLPEGVDTESASAHFSDGVLRIEIKAPQPHARGRRLQISDSDPGKTTGHPVGGGSQQQR